MSAIAEWVHQFVYWQWQCLLSTSSLSYAQIQSTWHWQVSTSSQRKRNPNPTKTTATPQSYSFAASQPVSQQRKNKATAPSTFSQTKPAANNQQNIDQRQSEQQRTFSSFNGADVDRLLANGFDESIEIYKTRQNAVKPAGPWGQKGMDIVTMIQERWADTLLSWNNVFW